VLKQSSYTMEQFQKSYHACMKKDPTAIEKTVMKMKVRKRGGKIGMG
jgi:ssDNA-specific exonuclease RecJ